MSLRVIRHLPSAPRVRAAALFAAASGGAVLVGCIVAAAHDLPAALWARNAGAWGFGALVAALLARSTTPRTLHACLWLATAVVATTLLSGGLSGVHRWIGIGPVRLNAAWLLLPMMVVAWTDAVSRRVPLWGVAPVISTLLALQPDASQAVALTGAVIAVLLALRVSRGFGLVCAAVPVVAALMAVLRLDPLQPVPEVEGIIGLALETSPVLALLAVVALACAVLSPLAAVAGQRGASRAAALGLTVYLALSALAPWVGAFLVPLVGMGVSPILGAWCGMGLLAGLAQPPRPPG